LKYRPLGHTAANIELMRIELHQAKVGIFWMFQGKLLPAAVPVSEGVEDTEAINGQADHVHYWLTLQRLHPELRNLEYEQVPRGRVLFLKEPKTFCVYMDKVLHKPKIKQALREEFGLPKARTRFLIDPHYTTDPDELAQLFRVL
jgi:hypothetical protein